MGAFVVCPECKQKVWAREGASRNAVRCPSCNAAIPGAVEVGPASGGRNDITADQPPPAPAQEGDIRAAPVRKGRSAGLVLGGFLVLAFAGCTGLIVYLTSARERTIPDSEWQAFTPPDGGFTVSVPGTPINMSQVLNGLAVTKYGVERLKDNKTFLVSYFDLDAPTSPPNLLEALASADRDHLAGMFKGRVTAEAPVTLGGIEGREFQIVAPDRSIVIGRIYVARVGGKYREFEVLVGGRLTPGKGDAARFFDSFKLDASAQPPPRGPLVQGPPPCRLAAIAGAAAAPAATPGAAVTNVAIATAAAGVPLWRVPDASLPRP